MSSLVYAVFLASAWLLAYTFIVYPTGIWLLARLRPQPVDKQPVLPTVSVVMVVRDGAMHIQAKLANLGTLNYPRSQLQVIVVCDGCRDGTPRLARQFKDRRVRVLEFQEPMGKAACLNRAVALAQGEVLLFTEVHQTLAPIALRELVANLADPHVGIASGELLYTDNQSGFAQGIDTYWRYEKTLRLAESQSGSTISVSSGLYAMRRLQYEPLPPDTMLDDVLIPMRMIASGRRVVFEPRALAWDRLVQRPEEDRPRRIHNSAGHLQLARLAPWLLSPQDNPVWLRFVSHKLLRLAAPWLMLSVALASLLLARRHILCAATLAMLVAGICLAAAGRLQPALSRWLPVRLALTFFYLNLFSAQALLTFSRHRDSQPW
ncbi:glycosyltransferase family 2 protein [Dyella solisilvae]|uniref:Glycosyltransferase family 2 protein n=1 Tax=Dyella solisilvae TaxID=1920168 RepID=A0A370K322_9GAMM|nr:glycosyltransferase family 2 protein [Dyella solisilvae]RDI97054.1 glycosyltransferase family 2 protein [Dyella solisilvae]